MMIADCMPIITNASTFNENRMQNFKYLLSMYFHLSTTSELHPNS